MAVGGKAKQERKGPSAGLETTEVLGQGATAGGDGADDFEDIVDSPYGNEHPGLPGDGQSDGDDPDAAETEFTIEDGATSAEDVCFDRTVGALQEIVLDNSFQAALHGFCREHCRHFEDTDENKLIYTELLKKYSDLIEGLLEAKLRQAVPGFAMGAFLEELARRGEEEVDAPVFDLLLSLGDFDSFKQQMLAEKRASEEKNSSSGALGSLAIAGKASKIHQDEDEEGELRPDLEDLLHVAPTGPASPAGAAARRGRT